MSDENNTRPDDDTEGHMPRVRIADAEAPEGDETADTQGHARAR
jgi:hypothetical protein